jgi:hypothetical protein
LKCFVCQKAHTPFCPKPLPLCRICSKSHTPFCPKPEKICFICSKAHSPFCPKPEKICFVCSKAHSPFCVRPKKVPLSPKNEKYKVGTCYVCGIQHKPYCIDPDLKTKKEKGQTKGKKFTGVKGSRKNYQEKLVSISDSAYIKTEPSFSKVSSESSDVKSTPNPTVPLSEYCSESFLDDLTNALDDFDSNIEYVIDNDSTPEDFDPIIKDILDDVPKEFTGKLDPPGDDSDDGPYIPTIEDIVESEDDDVRKIPTPPYHPPPKLGIGNVPPPDQVAVSVSYPPPPNIPLIDLEDEDPLLTFRMPHLKTGKNFKVLVNYRGNKYIDMVLKYMHILIIIHVFFSILVAALNFNVHFSLNSFIDSLLWNLIVGSQHLILRLICILTYCALSSVGLLHHGRKLYYFFTFSYLRVTHVQFFAPDPNDMRSDTMKRVDLKHPNPHYALVNFKTNFWYGDYYVIQREESEVFCYEGQVNATISYEVFVQIRNNKVMPLSSQDFDVYRKIDHSVGNVNTPNINRYLDSPLHQDTVLYSWYYYLSIKDHRSGLPFPRARLVTE